MRFFFQFMLVNYFSDYMPQTWRFDNRKAAPIFRRVCMCACAVFDLRWLNCPSNCWNAVCHARVWLAVCYFLLTSDLCRRPRGREREKQIATGGDGGHPAWHPEHVDRIFRGGQKCVTRKHLESETSEKRKREEKKKKREREREKCRRIRRTAATKSEWETNAVTARRFVCGAHLTLRIKMQSLD